MSTIYRKTIKGTNEIQTRAHRLAPRARSALILVDGLRSDEALAALIQLQADETLAMLLQEGFIEVAANTSAPPPPPPPPPAAPPAGRPLDLDLLRRTAVRMLNDQVGPAGETMSIRIERAKDLEALRPLLIAARSIIVSMRGEQAGADFISKLSAL
jgi:hypothetical protein